MWRTDADRAHRLGHVPADHEERSDVRRHARDHAKHRLEEPRGDESIPAFLASAAGGEDSRAVFTCASEQIRNGLGTSCRSASITTNQREDEDARPASTAACCPTFTPSSRPAIRVSAEASCRTCSTTRRGWRPRPAAWELNPATFIASRTLPASAGRVAAFVDGHHDREVRGRQHARQGSPWMGSHRRGVLVGGSGPGSGIRLDPVECVPHALSERHLWHSAEDSCSLAPIRIPVRDVGGPTRERAGDVRIGRPMVSNALDEGLVRMLAGTDVDHLATSIQPAARRTASTTSATNTQSRRRLRPSGGAACHRARHGSRTAAGGDAIPTDHTWKKRST